MNTIFLNYQTKFSITQQDLQNVQQVANVVLPQLPQLIADLFVWVRKESLFSEYISDEIINYTEQTQLKHWTSFFRGELDDAHFAGREKAGQVLSELGMPIEVYYSFVGKVNQLFEQLFEELGIASSQLSSSYHKIVNMDVCVVITAFLSIMQRALKEQNDALSTPVAELWDGILFLPLVGIIDSKRAQDVMLTMLQKVATTQSKVFILDISGVGVIDTAVANHLIKVTKATKLMGCICTISGISPAVAQTMVELGIQINEISTTNTMKDALHHAFKLVNVKELY